jgi:hypothetical protein
MQPLEKMYIVFIQRYCNFGSGSREFLKVVGALWLMKEIFSQKLIRLEYSSKCKQKLKIIITVSFVYTFPHIGISRSKLNAF